MEQYTEFARVYDLFMDNVPYDKWVKYLNKLLKACKVKPVIGSKSGDNPIICELGCGTGSMTRRLKAMGYDMIGIDISESMLQIAREQEPEGDDSILYLEQDMSEMELFGTVSAFVSVCDSINYVTEPEDLLKVFRLVNNYLDPDGCFIFDLNTPYYYSKVLGETTICENRDEGSFIWDNYYDPETKINEFDMTIYYKDGESYVDSYRRFEETHYQRAYSVAEVTKLIKRSGLELLHVYEAFTTDEPGKTTQRVYFVTKTSKHAKI